jgi:hypothetical protein
MKLHVVVGVLDFYSEDTRECGEKASPYVVIDVVICSSGDCQARAKTPARSLATAAVVGEGRVH